jgi:hypothetical protein
MGHLRQAAGFAKRHGDRLFARVPRLPIGPSWPVALIEREEDGVSVRLGRGLDFCQGDEWELLSLRHVSPSIQRRNVGGC